eukprot:975637-Prorocentrum_minimum.AAC.1
MSVYRWSISSGSCHAYVWFVRWPPASPSDGLDWSTAADAGAGGMGEVLLLDCHLRHRLRHPLPHVPLLVQNHLRLGPVRTPPHPPPTPPFMKQLLYLVDSTSAKRPAPLTAPMGSLPFDWHARPAASL